VAAKADPMATDTLWTMHFGVSVQSVVFSPDGQYVYAGAEWRSPKKIDVATGETVMEYNFREFDLIKRYSYDLEISQDGQYLAVSPGFSGQFSILHTETGEIYRNFDIPEDFKEKYGEPGISAIGLSPDFTKIAACALYNDSDLNLKGITYIFDIETGEVLQTLSGSALRRLEYSPDGSKLAYIGSYGQGFVGYLDTETWESENLGSHSEQGKDIAFSPDGTKLVSCGWDGYVNIWDVDENKKINEILFSVVDDEVWSLTYSEMGDYLFVINRNFTNTSMKTYSTLNYEFVDEYNYNDEFVGLSSPETLKSKFIDNKNIIISGNALGLIKFKLDKIISVQGIEYQSKVSIIPNPNNSLSTIYLNIKEADNFEIIVVNQEGVEIRKVYSGILEEGEHNFNWDGSKHPSGVYFCKITGRNINKTLKIILEK
jgi:WD40 repeat protein